MGKMKQLQIDLVEFEDEINELLTRVKKASPHVLSLLSNDGVTTEAKQSCLHNFTDDVELANLALVILDLQSQNKA